MKIKQFILDTLLPYKEDPNLCALEFDSDGNPNCLYKTSDGRKCAVGKHMKEGPWQEFRGDIGHLINSGGEIVVGEWPLERILTEEAYTMISDVKIWRAVQNYHDNCIDDNVNSISRNESIIFLETELGIELSELKT